MPRSKGNWDGFFKRSDPKNIRRRKRRGEKVKEERPASANLTFGSFVLPRLIGDPSIIVSSFSKSYIRSNADKRRANPTRAEAEFQRILNSLNSGALRGLFTREHVVSGRWIVDFFFPEIRLAIEIDGPIHRTSVQRVKDREKDADCRRFDVSVLRLSNNDVFGDRGLLVEKLRVGWRAAKNRENRIIGKFAKNVSTV